MHVDLTLAARYVRMLGLDPVTDADMLWVAEEAFHSPLPPHYTEEYDASGRPACVQAKLAKSRRAAVATAERSC